MSTKPNITTLLTGLTAPLQTIENALIGLRDGRHPLTATDNALDQIGAWVGQDREGMDDDLYRRAIMARIAANRSAGLTEDLVRVARLFVNNDLNGIEVRNEGSACVVVDIVMNEFDPNLNDNQTFIKLLRIAVDAGVRVILEFPNDTEPLSFRFSGTEAGVGFAGYGRLDLAPLTTNCETVVRAFDPGTTSMTLAFVADGSGTGNLDEAGLPAIVFHYESGVTTVANFETAVAASTNLRVQWTDVGGGTLTSPGDTFSATALTGGALGGRFATAID